MRSPAPDPQVPTDRDAAPAAPGFLDRTIEFDVAWWAAIGWAVVLAAAIALRFAKLGGWALSPDEAHRAYDAWLLFRGQPAPAGEALPATAPLFLLLQGVVFFLFGATDAIARIPAALCGFGIVALTPLLRRWIGAPAALGMAALAAISPTLVYASRVADPAPLVAFLALFLVVAILRAGIDTAPAGAIRRWAVVTGVVLAALLAAGPGAITVLVALAVAFVIAARDPAGAPRLGLTALANTRGALPALAVGFLVTLVTLFSRLWSDPAALIGIVQTFGDWIALLTRGPAAVPTSFFLLSLVLYEPVSLVLALFGAARGRSLPGSPALGTLFGAWFVAALLLWSFSAGRTPQPAIQVALPLVLLAGGVLGDLLARIDWNDVRRGAGTATALSTLGLIVGLGALGVLVHRAADPFQRSTASITAAIVMMAVIVPLVWSLRNQSARDRLEGRPREATRIAFAVVIALLMAYGLRSATQLALYRAADGTELLAQGVATGAVVPAVDGIDRLSRDVTIDQGSVRDVTGGHGLTVAAERSVEWPFRWYFRDFPDFTTIGDGEAAGSDAQVVIAPAEAVLSRSGYTVHAVPWRNGVPGPYADPDPLALLAQALDPRQWFDDVQFLLFRQGIEPPVATNVNIGLDASLAARVSPATGPYSLSDHPGPGSAPGQFDQPIGVAAAPDGTIYVVDQGNARVERFDSSGAYLGAWDAKSGLALGRTENGLGPTGVAVAPDGTVYVADTWNHRVVALDRSGKITLDLGGPAGPNGTREAADTTDNPALVTTKEGEFFGPRAVAIDGDEIYVVDTGNERVQVFGRDGSFKRVWGGYGSAPGQLIEPVGIAIGPDGLVYVADSGNARISLFTKEGKPVAQWPVPAWPPKDPSGARPSFQPYLAFGPDGLLYASSSQTGSVEVLDRHGKTIDSIRMAGPDQLQKPIGVAFAPNGTLLISDIGRNAVFETIPSPPPNLGAATPLATPAATPIG